MGLAQLDIVFDLVFSAKTVGIKGCGEIFEEETTFLLKLTQVNVTHILNPV